MCYDTIEEMAAAIDDARMAKSERDKFERIVSANMARDGADEYHIQLSAVEAREVYRTRLERAEQRIAGLGWPKPAKRVTEGERAAELAAMGHTLPGTLPVADVPIE